MITRPLDLESRLSQPPRDFTAVAWVNVGVIALFFSLLGSRFVLAPGFLIELPKVNAASANAVETSVVLKFSRDNLILLGTGMYTMAELKGPLEEAAKKYPGTTLQVNIDRQVSMQALADLSDLAAAAGFGNILVAGDRQAAPDNPPK
jgi:biopolymer transport protein ExbD